jgi:glycerol-3-phosphate dehydrogenase
MSDGGILRKVDKVIRKKRFENIDVKVEDSVVYLNGKVSSWDDFVEIGSLIGVIKNIRGVVNRLEYPGEIRRERKKGNREKSGEADVVIIGGGVTGCSIARELSKYKVKVILVEKEDDVACGATKAMLRKKMMLPAELRRPIMPWFIRALGKKWVH